MAEVYASIFGPDPIEYRAERGLLDFHEEMGIMIQEVVGTRVGRYFLPAFAGVAFSNNEFRWSPRIKREDGLVAPRARPRHARRRPRQRRLPGADRPGPARACASTSRPRRSMRYSPQADRRHQPRRRNRFETMDIADLLQRVRRASTRRSSRSFSVYEDDGLHARSAARLDVGTRQPRASPSRA
ncbi:MAG: PEP/pyruvate-binding domain-containing protein [Ignavibacteriales bacterium]|nr:PEP/pyruvate-binding domain-containing protein [Ignavibacteriales bacterium]